MGTSKDRNWLKPDEYNEAPGECVVAAFWVKNEDCEPNRQMVQCPFNPAHKMKQSRLAGHIIKCEKNYPNHNKVRCFFSVLEYIDKDKILEHEQQCPLRFNYARLNPATNPAIAVVHPQVQSSQTTWETIDKDSTAQVETTSEESVDRPGANVVNSVMGSILNHNIPQEVTEDDFPRNGSNSMLLQSYPKEMEVSSVIQEDVNHQYVEDGHLSDDGSNVNSDDHIAEWSRPSSVHGDRLLDILEGSIFSDEEGSYVESEEDCLITEPSLPQPSQHNCIRPDQYNEINTDSAARSDLFDKTYNVERCVQPEENGSVFESDVAVEEPCSGRTNQWVSNLQDMAPNRVKENFNEHYTSVDFSKSHPAVQLNEHRIKHSENVFLSRGRGRIVSLMNFVDGSPGVNKDKDNRLVDTDKNFISKGQHGFFENEEVTSKGQYDVNNDGKFIDKEQYDISTNVNVIKSGQNSQEKDTDVDHIGNALRIMMSDSIAETALSSSNSDNLDACGFSDSASQSWNNRIPRRPLSLSDLTEFSDEDEPAVYFTEDDLHQPTVKDENCGQMSGWNGRKSYEEEYRRNGNRQSEYSQSPYENNSFLDNQYDVNQRRRDQYKKAHCDDYGNNNYNIIQGDQHRTPYENTQAHAHRYRYERYERMSGTRNNENSDFYDNTKYENDQSMPHRGYGSTESRQSCESGAAGRGVLLRRSLLSQSNNNKCGDMGRGSPFRFVTNTVGPGNKISASPYNQTSMGRGNTSQYNLPPFTQNPHSDFDNSGVYPRGRGRFLQQLVLLKTQLPGISRMSSPLLNAPNFSEERGRHGPQSQSPRDNEPSCVKAAEEKQLRPHSGLKKGPRSSIGRGGPFTPICQGPTNLFPGIKASQQEHSKYKKSPGIKDSRCVSNMTSKDLLNMPITSVSGYPDPDPYPSTYNRKPQFDYYFDNEMNSSHGMDRNNSIPLKNVHEQSQNFEYGNIEQKSTFKNFNRGNDSHKSKGRGALLKSLLEERNRTANKPGIVSNLYEAQQ